MSSKERGSAAVFLLLAILLVMTVAAMTASVSSTTAQLTERDRANYEKAKLNAQSALVDATAWIESETMPSLKALIEESARQQADYSGAVLETLQFPVYSKRFRMHGSGATAEDFSDVEARIELAGPARELSLSGGPAASGSVRIQEYRFYVSLTSTGHAPGGAIASYGQRSYLMIEIELVPEV